MTTIKSLNHEPKRLTDEKSVRIYNQFAALLDELRKRDLPQHLTRLIDEHVDQINSASFGGAALSKLILKKQTLILKQLEKELKVVPQNYYRNLWMLFGFSGFGLPIGVAIAMSIGNIGLLGIGLPIGMAIGLAVGRKLDKKALVEGRQMNIEIKN